MTGIRHEHPFPTLKKLDVNGAKDLVLQAQSSERQRKNFNFHPELDDPIQRLANAFEPGTYVPPHRHIDPDRWEMFLLIEGRAAILVFDDEGKVTDRAELGRDNDSQCSVAEIPPGAWHSVVALTAGTVLFEVKAGPYARLTDKGFASWAPRENETQAARSITKWMEQAQVGDLFVM
ncbi:WbuC family cupin fold metalloprotein [Magnetofaba australis]|uniref:Putative O-antigen related protein n=1 Tax=Magnetofaba australis IT-1 TaxID=1434232 RepID=A0A1Y2K5Q4_9PROT|nr:WbuC family cupin fold metalloprotein [Magnetofaba australis]OSM05032.1 putative O-antigen related protein [Magnetofaba australis IT-1]